MRNLVPFLCALIIFSCSTKGHNENKNDDVNNLSDYIIESSSTKDEENGILSGYELDSLRSIYSFGGSRYNYLVGRRVYPETIDSTTISSIKEENDIYICMIKDKDPNVLLVYSNLLVQDFSIGEPFDTITNDEIFKKFSTNPSVIEIGPVQEHCQEGDCECGPFYFMIITSSDSIWYMRPNDSGPYRFDEAKIHSDSYRFGEYSVGTDLHNCKLGTILPDTILQNLSVIEFSDYKNKFFWGNTQEPEHGLGVRLFLDKGIINKISIWYEP